MNRGNSTRAQAVLDSLVAGEVTRAIRGLLDLIAQGLRERAVDLDLWLAWEPYKRLLHRRGYYASTAAEIRETLSDIAAMGSGFDLYDLSRALADYDTLLADCLQARRGRFFPELGIFASKCPCGRHGGVAR
jgi:hypothetical protein